MKISKSQLKRIIWEAMESTPGDYYRQRAIEKEKVQDDLAAAREVLADLEPRTPEYRTQFDVVRNLERNLEYTSYVGD
jgi:hypothetical protein